MMTFKDTSEIDRQLAEIDKNADPEEQGYLSAPLIMTLFGFETPEELLRYMVRAGEPTRNEINISRDIGVIRWCLEQRRMH